jgi:glyoxylase I family protein
VSDDKRMRLRGLHHVTAICRDLERTIAFYRDTLGLPVVRDAPSDDDPEARHVWFDAGDGTFVTFMEYGLLPEGVVGRGSTHHFALRVGTHDEQQAWRDYLRERGAFQSLYVRDPDGHVVEIATGAGGPPTERTSSPTP